MPVNFIELDASLRAAMKFQDQTKAIDAILRTLKAVHEYAGDEQERVGNKMRALEARIMDLENRPATFS